MSPAGDRPPTGDPGEQERAGRGSVRTLERRVGQLLLRRVSRNPLAEHRESRTVGERAADRLAEVAGSWAFIYSFLLFLGLWIVVNTIAAFRHWDPYPFILLNLLLSCLAAIQAPVILMSQNRQESRDRLRAENDYQVNIKAEILLENLTREVQDLHTMLAALRPPAPPADGTPGSPAGEGAGLKRPADSPGPPPGQGAGGTESPGANRSGDERS